MDRINTATKAVDLYGVGKHGFKNSNVGLGTAPTAFNADWPNGVQEELVRTIEAAGIVPSTVDLTQLLAALRVLFGQNHGCIELFARSTAPTGYLKANGALVSRATYANLFAAIGTTFGVGDGVTTFALPDLRGEFLRGWDDSRGIDSGRAFGAWQKGTIHMADTSSSGAPDALYNPCVINNPSLATAQAALGYDTLTTSDYNNVQAAAVSSTTSFTLPLAAGVYGAHGASRPRNVALLACIKY